MRRLIWKLRFAFYMWRYCKRNVPLHHCWTEATAMAEDFSAINEGWSPTDAAHEAMSYWSD